MRNFVKLEWDKNPVSDRILPRFIILLTFTADNTPLFVSIDQEDHGLCLEAKFDNFAYYYHRFDLPTLNYSICTGGKNTSDLYGIKDGQGDMKKLHNYFLPKTFWHGHDTDVFQKLQTLVEKPIWQVILFWKTWLDQY